MTTQIIGSTGAPVFVRLEAQLQSPDHAVVALLGDERTGAFYSIEFRSGEEKQFLDPRVAQHFLDSRSRKIAIKTPTRYEEFDKSVVNPAWFTTSSEPRGKWEPTSAAAVSYGGGRFADTGKLFPDNDEFTKWDVTFKRRFVSAALLGQIGGDHFGQLDPVAASEVRGELIKKYPGNPIDVAGWNDETCNEWFEGYQKKVAAKEKKGDKATK